MCQHQTEVNHYSIITELPNQILTYNMNQTYHTRDLNEHTGVFFHKTAYTKNDVPSRDVLERCENMNGLILNSSALFKNVLYLSALN